jgi:hypothetical protein
VRRFVADVRAAISERFAPRIHVLSDEDQQSADEHARVIAEWVGSHRHPRTCVTECHCRPEDFPGGAA